MASDSIRRSNLEVERKFVPTALLQAQLDGRYGDFERLRRLQGGSKAAQQASALSFFRLPDKEIRDEYYDYQDKLSKRGVWLRERTARTIQTHSFPLVNESEPTSRWEAKLRMAGDYTSSQMLEAFGPENMNEVCALYLSPGEDKLIAVIAELKTRRKTYVVQKPFGWHHAELNAEGEVRVVVDEVTSPAKDGEGREGGEGFKHVVGEVELTAEVAGGDSDREHDLLRRREMARMQMRLNEFVRRHEVSFPKEGVKGKLEAFFEWKEECSGFGAMV